VVKLLSHLRKTHGIFSGDQIVKWLRDRLRRHLSVKTVKFADLITPLKIVAADVTSGTVRVFSQVSTPGYSVAEAVRASISIPFFFRPHRVSSHIFNTNEVETTLVLVDGGLVSNFPAWVFDDEAKRLPNITYPVVGFRLLGDGAPLDTSTLLSYARAVYEVGVGAPPYLEKRGVRNLIEVSIRTPGVGTFDFGIDDEPDEQTALNAQNCKG
jgi:NTE family protein